MFNSPAQSLEFHGIRHVHSPDHIASTAIKNDLKLIPGNTIPISIV